MEKIRKNVYTYKRGYLIYDSEVSPQGEGARAVDYEFLPVKFENTYHIRDSVFSILRSAILDGKLKPGEHLVERDIAAQMRISRTPVREAIRKLENEQLVTHIPRRGVFVAGFTQEDVREIETIRMALESLCCRIAAQKITEAELNRLEAMNEELFQAGKKGAAEQAVAVNRRFHDEIYKSAKSPHLYYFVSTLREYIQRFTSVAYTRPGRVEAVYKEHQELLAYLRRHDSDGAYEAAKRHVEQSSQVFLEMTQP